MAGMCVDLPEHSSQVWAELATTSSFIQAEASIILDAIKVVNFLIFIVSLMLFIR